MSPRKRKTSSFSLKRFLQGLRPKRISSRAKKTNDQLVINQVLAQKGASKIPAGSQIRHFSKLLTSSEKMIIRIGLFLIIFAGIILGGNFLYQNRQLKPAIGGEYTEGLIGIPQLINPLYSFLNDVDSDLSQLIYSGLMRYDQNNGLSLDLAESYDISEDGLIYTFYLRDNAKWHDDAPISTNDILFTIQAIKNDAYHSPLQSRFENISVEIIDEKTITFTLAEPFAAFPSLLTIGILPSHLWSNIPPINTPLTELNKKPIGSGPYIFDKLVKDSSGNIKSYTLKHNEAYYLEGPYIETLHFKFYPDIITAVEALKNNNVEGLSYAQLEDTVSFASDNRLQIAEPRLNQYTGAFFNLESNGIIQDLSIRKALGYATNKEALVESSLYGYAHTIDSFILPGMPGESGSAAPYTFNQDMAESLLDEAGWTKDESGMRSKDGINLNLTITTINSSEMVRVAEALQMQWQEIGIGITITPIPSSTFSSIALEGRDYDILLSGELYNIEPDPYTFWHSSQANYPGLNLSQFINRQADEIIETARIAQSDNEKAEKYLALQEIINEQIPAIFLYQPIYPYITSDEIKGIDLHLLIEPADRFTNIHEWYIKTRREKKTDDTEELSEQNTEIEEKIETEEIDNNISESEEISKNVEDSETQENIDINTEE